MIRLVDCTATGADGETRGKACFLKLSHDRVQNFTTLESYPILMNPMIVILVYNITCR